MSTNPPEKMSLGSLGGARRRSVNVTPEALVQVRPLNAETDLPTVVTPAVAGVDLVAWAANNRELIESTVLKTGGILFRGFGINTVEAFQQFTDTFKSELLSYSYRSTPRTQVSGNIFTSTEYPPHLAIPLHNEMCYTRTWPMKIWFCSLVVAETGGETPIADSRRIYNRIDPAVREEFARKGVMYVRNYGDGIDLPWQEVFQTNDRETVSQFCRESDIDFEWLGADRLRTRQVCQGVAKHPATGEMVWFNQAHLFHWSGLPEDVREVLRSAFGEEDLPRNTLYGDGTPIPLDVLDHIRTVLGAETVMFPWEQGDVMMLDNMLAAHARSSFTGSRRVVVGMAQPCSQAQ